jgi:opacity protein-like surface antigen
MANFKVIALAGTILFSSSAFADNASDRYVYIGTEFGISEPVVKNFIYKSSQGDTKMRLKQSRMYGGRVGYSFYPNMSIEVSGTHQPQFRLGYKHPSIDLTSSLRGLVAQGAIALGAPAANAAAIANATIQSGTAIPSTSDITKVAANVFTMNLLYEFEKQKFDIKPYVIFGAGLAQVSIKPKTTSWKPEPNIAALPGIGAEVPFFKVKKNVNNCFVYQMGGGLSKDLTDNFAVDLGAKLQVIKDIKIKYDTFDVTTQSFKSQTPIKKTIGVGEFTLGFTFKIPVK